MAKKIQITLSDGKQQWVTVPEFNAKRATDYADAMVRMKDDEGNEYDVEKSSLNKAYKLGLTPFVYDDAPQKKAQPKQQSYNSPMSYQDINNPDYWSQKLGVEDNNPLPQPKAGLDIPNLGAKNAYVDRTFMAMESEANKYSDAEKRAVELQKQLAEAQKRAEAQRKKMAESRTYSQTPYGLQAQIMPDTAASQKLAEEEKVIAKLSDELRRNEAYMQNLQRLEDTAREIGTEGAIESQKDALSFNPFANPYMGSNQRATSSLYQFNDKQTQAAAIGTNVRDTRRLLREASLSNDSFFAKTWRGFKDTMFDAATWDGGATELRNSLATLKASIADAQGLGSKGSKAILESAAIKNDVASKVSGAVSMWYNAGLTTGQMLPFAAQIFASPLSGLGKSSQQIFANWTRKQIESSLISKMMSQSIQTAMVKGLGGVGRFAGDVLGGTGTAAIFANQKIAADALNRYQGTHTGSLTTDGRFLYTGAQGGKSMWKSILEAMATQGIEYQSELVGEYFTPLSKLLQKGLGKAVGYGTKETFDAVGNKIVHHTIGLPGHKISLDKTVNLLSRMTSEETLGAVRKGLRQAGYNGVIGEYLEEVVGNMENALLGINGANWGTGEGGVFNKKENLETLLAVAVGSGFMGGLGGAGGILHKAQINRDYKRANGEGLQNFGWQAWQSIKDQIDNAAVPELPNIVLNLTEGMNERQKSIIQYYATRAVAKQGSMMADFKLELEKPKVAEVKRDMSQLDKFVLDSYDISGNRLASREFKSEEDMNLYENMVRAYIDNGKYLNHYNRLLSTDKGRDAAEAAAANLGYTLGEMSAIFYEDPITRSESVQNDLDRFIQDTKHIAFPSNEVNTDQESQDGTDLADGSQLGDQQVIDTVNQREKNAIEQWNKVKTPDIESRINDLLSQGYSINDVADVLAYENYQESIIDAFCEMCNAGAFKDAFIAKTGEKIQDEVAQQVHNNTFAGTLDTQRQPSTIIALQDEQGNTYSLIGGDINSEEVTDDAGNATTLLTSDGLVILRDQNGELVQKPNLEGFTFIGSNSAEEYSAQLLQQMQEAVTAQIESTEAQDPEVQDPATPPAAPIQDQQNTTPVIPVDEKGQKLYSQAPVEDTVSDITNELGGDLNSAVTVVKSMADKAAKTLDDAQKNMNKPPKGNTPQEIILDLNERKSALANAQAEVDYWNNAYAHAAKILAEKDAPVNQDNVPLDLESNPIVKKWNEARKVYGHNATLTLEDGSTITGRYVMTESDAATPSHDPFTFEPSQGFPVDENGNTANNRDYQHDKHAQETTIQQGNDLNGLLFQNVPYVKWGVVMSGNGRVSARQRAAKFGTDQKYLDAVFSQGHMYGFNQEDTKSFAHPLIQFEIDDDIAFDAKTFARFNQVGMKNMNLTERAVEAGKVVQPTTIGQINTYLSGFDTLAQAYSDKKTAKLIIDSLIRDGVITSNDAVSMFNADGSLTGEGIDFVENVLLGNVVSEESVRILSTMKPTRQIIVRAIPAIVKNGKFEGYSIAQNIDNAIRLIANAKAAQANLYDYLRMQDAFEGMNKDRYSKVDAILARAMELGLTDFREFMNRLNEKAEAYAYSNDMFEGEITLNDTINQLIETLSNKMDSLAQQKGKKSKEAYYTQQIIKLYDNETGQGQQPTDGQEDKGTDGTGQTDDGTGGSQRDNGQQPGDEIAAAIKKDIEDFIAKSTNDVQITNYDEKEFEAQISVDGKPSNIVVTPPMEMGEGMHAEYRPTDSSYQELGDLLDEYNKTVDKKMQGFDGEHLAAIFSSVDAAIAFEKWMEQKKDENRTNLPTHKQFVLYKNNAAGNYATVSGNPQSGYVVRYYADKADISEDLQSGIAIGESTLTPQEFKAKLDSDELAEEQKKAEIKPEKSWDKMTVEEQQKEAFSNLLTEEEIMDSNADSTLKANALAFINGKKGVVNSISYFTIYKDVKHGTGSRVADSEATDETQLDETNSRGNRGKRTQRGRSGLHDRILDTEDSGQEHPTGDREQLQRGEDGKGRPADDTGKGSDMEVPGDKLTVDGPDTRGDEPGGSGSTDGNGHNVPSRRGEGRGRKNTDSNRRRQDKANRGGDKGNNGRDSQSIDDELRDAMGDFNDIIDQWNKAKHNGELSMALIPFNKTQIELMPKIITKGAKVGYVLLKKGFTALSEWSAQMKIMLTPPLQSIGVSDAEVDSFIKEMWNCNVEIDGETHTISEWSKIIGNEKLKEKVRMSIAEKRQKQLEAEPIEVKIADKNNIEETLPFLLPLQQEDVYKAEMQFFDESHNDYEHANGKGFMFTNGTGTGKTYTGLGIAKRFIKQGKGRILILTPSSTKVGDWVLDAGNLNIEANSLEDWAKAHGTNATAAKGEGVIVTTYANFRQNQALLEDEFDLIIYDESHRLLENKEGRETEGSRQHYMLTNKNEQWAFNRLALVDPVYQAIQDAKRKFDAEYKKEKALFQDAQEAKAVLPVLESDISNFADYPKLKEIKQKYDELTKRFYNEVKPQLQEKAKESVKKTKVVFLSATPFNTRENLGYAEGYIFQYPNTGGRIGPRSQFYLNNFGAAYRWRNNRLESRTTNPDAVTRQEIAFSDYLQNQLGTLSGRVIDSEFDYSRDFPTVTFEKADELNRAFEEIKHLEDNIMRKAFYDVMYNYQYTSVLFEAMKTSCILPRIKEHLKAGRNVVIFHRRMETASPVVPPFSKMINEAYKLINNLTSTRQKEVAKAQIAEFEEKYASLLEWEGTLDFRVPRVQIMEAFGEESVLFFSGKETSKQKDAAVKDFNDDNSPKKIIVIQEASGKEGISLHDTTGKNQRVLISLAMPQSPITALQVEGRIYRIGNRSNAIFEYPLLGLDEELVTWGQRFNAQVGTTENLALGSKARNLRESFATAVIEHSGDVPLETQGTGGKAMDEAISQDQTDPFDKSVLDYYGNQKTSGRRDNREGKDYYPTPEPLGFMMVQWANLSEGESALEPSAGHGAIARYVPTSNNLTSVEPSTTLFGRLQVLAGGVGRKFENDIFENYNIVNKHDVVLMNPPFGTAGRLAIDHVAKAFKHLSEGGRIVAIIPRGAADAKFDSWIQTEKSAALVGEIQLPDITFQNAGTKVNCRVVVIDKVTDDKMRNDALANAKHINLSNKYAKIEDFFEDLRGITMPARTIDQKHKNDRKLMPIIKEVKDEFGDKMVVEFTSTGVLLSGIGFDYPSNIPADALKLLVASQYARANKQLQYIPEKLTRAIAAYQTIKRMALKLTDMSEEEMDNFVKANIKDSDTKKPVSEQFQYEVRKNTRTGEDMFVASKNKGVNLTDDEYNNARSLAKANGGYWSKYVGGFVFPSEVAAKAFLNGGVQNSDSTNRLAYSSSTNNVNNSRIIPEDVDKSVSLQIENEFDSAIESLNLTDKEKKELDKKIEQYSNSSTIDLEDTFYLNNSKLRIRDEKKNNFSEMLWRRGSAVSSPTTNAGGNIRDEKGGAESLSAANGQSAPMVSQRDGETEGADTTGSNEVQGQNNGPRDIRNTGADRLFLHEGRRIEEKVVSKTPRTQLSSYQRRLLAEQYAISRELVYREIRLAALQQSLGLQGGKPTSLDDIAAAFEKTNTDKQVKTLFDKILAVNKRLGTSIEVAASDVNNNSGSAGTRRDVHYYLDGFTRTSAGKIQVPVVLAHELLHQGTIGAINLVRKGKAEGVLTKEQIDAVNTIIDIYNKVSANSERLSESPRGLANPYEFAAQMVDPRQRKALSMSPLQRIMSAANVLKAKGDTSLWDRIKNALKTLFGMSDLKKMDNAINTLLDTFNETVHDISMANADQNGWGYTSTQLFDKYPTWLSGQTTGTGQHTTQITSTVNTYKKIGDWMKSQGMEGATVLDASSGLGKGTEALKGMGFNVEDVEPYPSENRTAPTYLRYEDINGKYDVVISNAVLNVIPDDWRADVLKNMADKVKPGGKMIINVRDAKEIERQKQKIELDSPSEILVTDKAGNIRAYQKGFTQKELADWIQSELGEGWQIETAKPSNSGISGRAVVVTRNSDTPLLYRKIESNPSIIETSNKKIQKIFKEIDNNGFNDVTLQHINELFNEIENGKAIYNRYKQHEIQGLREAGRAAFGASCIASYVARSQGAGRYGSLVGAASKKEQLDKIKEYAQKEGLWFDNIKSELQKNFGEPFASGMEADVYRESDKTVVKHKDGFYSSPLEAIDAIVLHNTLFPETAMEIIGFGESNGDIQLVVRQLHINIEREATQEEIDDFAKSKGLTKKGDHYVNEDIDASDFHYGNIVIDAVTNKPVCIDCNITFNSKVQAQGNRMPGSLSVKSPNAQVSAESQSQMKAHAQEVASSLNTPVRFVTADQIPDSEKSSKGYYNTKTGEVVIILDNNTSTHDIEQTIVHEVVGHKGLRGLLGSKGLYTLLDSIYNNMSDSQKKDIHERARRNGWQMYTAVEEYLAEQAENTVWDSDSASLWQNIKHYLTEALRNIGFRLFPNLKDARYWIWLSQNQLRKGDVMSSIKRNALLDKLDRMKAPPVQTKGTIIEPEKLLRSADYVQYATYNNIEDRLKQKTFYWNEAYADHMASYKIFQEEMEKGLENGLQDNMNAYELENQSSSAIAQRQYNFIHHELHDLQEEIKGLWPEFGKGQEGLDNLENYLMEKHGLERNRVLHMRDWYKSESSRHITSDSELSATAQNYYSQMESGIWQDYDDGKIDEKERDKRLKEALYEAHMRYLDETMEDFRDVMNTQLDNYENGFIPLSQAYGEIDNFINQHSTFDPNKKDKSGLTALKHLFSGLKYEDDKVIQDVEDRDRQLGDKAHRLMSRLQDVTQFALFEDYKNGIVTKEGYERARNMFRYYIPLRGYSDTTMEDIYQYMTNTNGTGVKSLVHAKGRKTRADSPIATAAHMALKSIQRGQENQVKLAAYRMVNQWQKDNPDDVPPATVVNLWTVLDATGDFVIKTPTITDSMTAEEIRDAVRNFEETMKALERVGKAQKLKSPADFRHKFESKNHQNEHIVPLMINGRARAIVFNGNPRPAMALRGDLAPKRSNEFGMDSITSEFNRFMSGMFTSFNPSFMVTNLFRDTLFSNNNVAINEGMEYYGKFSKNQALLLTKDIGRYAKLKWDYDKGIPPRNEMEQYFYEFMENGGKTGFVDQYNISKIKKHLEIGNKEKSVPRRGFELIKYLPEGISAINERIENINRFACYMTSRQMGRSITRSVKDAKEVSVNFNRRGAGSNTAKVSDSKWASFAGNSAQFCRGAYLFFNAGVQSLALFSRNLKKHPVKTSIFAVGIPMVLGGFVLPMFNQILAEAFGDGDDPYANLPQWERRNNFCFYIGNGMFIKIPLPIELRAFYGLGDIAAGYLVNEHLRSLDNVAYDVASQLTQILPIDFLGEDGSLAMTFTFDAFKPALQIMLNKDWTGKPIWKENEWNKYAPEYRKAFKNEFEPFVSLSAWINESLGGTANTRSKYEGKWNNPAIWHAIMQGYGGGAVMDLVRLGNLGKKALTGDFSFKANEWPIAKSVVTTPSEKTKYYRFLNKYYRYKEESEQFDYNLKQWMKSKDPLEHSLYLNHTDPNNPSPEYKRAGMVKAFEGHEKQANKAIYSDDYPEEMKEALQEQLNRERVKLVNELDQIK